MGNPIKEIGDVVGKIGSAIDDNVESGEERSQQQSARHVTDMSSDSWLSKNIRPMTLLFLMACQLAIIIGMLFGLAIDQWVIGQVGTLLFGGFSFYFSSRKAEKIAAKNASANIRIKKMELREKRRERKRK